MDTIKFVIEDHGDEEFGYKFPVINIQINGQDLIDLITKVERRDWNGEKDSRSGYIGFEASRLKRFRSEILGNKVYLHSILLTCTCTIEECNCIMANIVFEENTVTWNDLRSPWLGRSNTHNLFLEDVDAIKDGWVPIDYSGLGPFVFDKAQYLSALEQETEEWFARNIEEAPTQSTWIFWFNHGDSEEGTE